MEQRAIRVKDVLDQVVEDGCRSIFRDCWYNVYLDKKWFYAMKDGTKTWLLPNNDHLLPPQSQSKVSILKFLFLAAIGHPHNRDDGTRFNSLLGVRHHRGDISSESLKESALRTPRYQDYKRYRRILPGYDVWKCDPNSTISLLTCKNEDCVTT